MMQLEESDDAIEILESLNHDQFMASLLHVFSAHVEEALLKTMELKLYPPDVRNADFILCNTVQELEPENSYQLKIDEKPFYAIGPALSTRSSAKSDVVIRACGPESDCTHWLDLQQQASVLYVSFGSYAHITKSDLVEIAYGLSLSKVRFIWVLRPDIVRSDDDPNLLPEDFKDEIRDRGLVVPWCCQNKR
ncbi:hypothetical protein HAX54_048706 [Datura stramonium]|uniref:Uncharacterized protein n=1 Tax=Datura stramonium TaxID=4076 RepID=A0ABS8SVY8_DATST|nr:hypothetical protein [Datura stramonium]